MMNRIIVLILAGLLLLGSPVAFAAAETTEYVWVDFGNHTGVPLLKRQNTFSVSYSFLGGATAGFMRDSSALQGLRSENMRVDMSMGNGGLGSQFAQGTLDNMTHQFGTLDILLEQLYANGTQPYFSYSFMPGLLQPDNGDWRSPPRDYEAWKQLCYDIAEHYLENGWPLAANEIWNEPDLGTTFYNGSWEEFVQMYDYAARGIREANPNATVGGMSLAFVQNIEQNKIRSFLDHVQENELPMDFISYHNYSTWRYVNETRILNRILSEYGDTFSNLGLHINEFHVSEGWDRANPGMANSANMASLAVEAILRIVDMPTITSVNWATWRDEGLGLSMMNLSTGQRSAVYHAIKCYNDMPIDRVAFNGTRYVNGFASVDEQAAGVMLYTRSVTPMNVTVYLNNLPFDCVDVKVYAIDAEHSSIYDGCESDALQTIDAMTDVSTEGLSWSGTIGAQGILYIRIIPAGEKVVKKAVWSMEDDTPIAGEVATVIRKEYYFEDRTSTMFSEFDLGTFTAWAGMGNRDTGMTRGAVLLQNLPETLTISPTVYGHMADGAGCFLYAEYMDEEGKALQTCAWTLGNDVWKPEGLNAQAETFSLEQAVTLETPENFIGTLKLTWGMINAGQDVTMKLTVSK